MNRVSSIDREKASTGTNRLVKIAGMLLLPLLVAAIAACDSNSSSSATPTLSVPLGTATTAPTASLSRAPYEGVPEGKPLYSSTNQPDIPEMLETKPVGELPSFALTLQSSSRDKVIAEYAGAVDHFDAYSHIPCYCGCAMYEHPHSSLARCFVTEMKGDGQVEFTDHSTTCEKCQGVAEMTLAGVASNRPLAEVRADIFQKFKYTGTWTDTPAP